MHLYYILLDNNQKAPETLQHVEHQEYPAQGAFKTFETLMHKELSRYQLNQSVSGSFVNHSKIPTGCNFQSNHESLYTRQSNTPSANQAEQST